jgi:hypothetical protein
VNCHCIGYPDKSKGYHFYCPDRFTKFVETRQAVFLEDAGISGSFPRRKINLEEIRAELPIPKIQETITHNNTAVSIAVHALCSEYTFCSGYAFCSEY